MQSKLWDNQINYSKVSEGERKALSREISIQKSLSHPNIVALLGSFHHEDKLYIFLECMDRNLFEYSKGKIYGGATALKIFYEVCKAVAFLHSKNLLHRDIKPENILLSKNGDIKLSDFGFSANFGFSESRNTMCGTKEYLPPEIIENKTQTEKVDIWCLGVLLYELLHKRLPFEGKNFDILMENIRKKRINMKEGISQEIKDIIKLCLQENPAERPTADELLANPVFLKINDGVKPIQISRPTTSGSVPPKSDQQRTTQFLNAIYQNGTGNLYTNIPNVINVKQPDSHKHGQNESVSKRPFFNDHSQIYKRPVTQEINRSNPQDSQILNSVIYKHNNQLQNSINFAPSIAESRLDSAKPSSNPFNVDVNDNLKRSNTKSGNQTPSRNTDPDLLQKSSPGYYEIKNSHNNPTGILLYRYNENQNQGQHYAQQSDVQTKLQTAHPTGNLQANQSNSLQNSFIGLYQSANDQQTQGLNGKRDISAHKIPNEMEAMRLDELGSPTYRAPKRIETHHNQLHFSYEFTDKTPIHISSTISSTAKYYQVQTPRESNRLADHSGKVPQLYKNRMRTPEVSQSRGSDNPTVHSNILNSAMQNSIQASPDVHTLTNSPTPSTLHQSLVIKNNGRMMSPIPTNNNSKFAKPVNAQQIEQYASQSFAKVKSHGENRSNVSVENVRSMTPNVYHPLNR